jgi:hypothetical protein
MTATIEQIAKLRRMTAEPTDTTYSDAELVEYIEAYPLVDAEGYAPNDPSWTATYDMNQAAADIWNEKAAVLAGNYDFSADGSSFHRSQAYNQAMQQSRYYRSRRSIKTIALRPEPQPRSAFSEDTSDDSI